MRERNLTFELLGHATTRPEATAIHLEASKVTFGQLEGLVDRAATFLRCSDISEGDVVAVSIANDLSALIAMLGIVRIGATIYTVPLRAPQLLRQQMLELASARILLTDGAATVPAGQRNVRFDVETLARAQTPIDGTLIAPCPSAPWLIITGSGSTGVSKRIPVSHGQFRARALLANEALGISQDDKVATFLSMEFAAGKTRYFEALFAGASIVLPDESCRNPVAFCRKHSVTVLHSTVYHIRRLLDALPARAENFLPGLRALQVNASTVSGQLRSAILEALSRNLYVRYGSNESGIISIATPEEVASASGTVGRPVRGLELQIASPAGEVLPDGKVGLIRVRSAGVFDGYLDDVATSRRVLRSGWFYPGDLGYVAADGQLIYCGRADQMMIMNGINIYPSEIESVVTSHPAVHDAAAVPLHHSVHQHVPVCAVTLKEGATVSEQELLEYSIQRLGARGPKRILRLESVPRNEQGKLLRAQLMQVIHSRLGLKNPAGAPLAPSGSDSA